MTRTADERFVPVALPWPACGALLALLVLIIAAGWQGFVQLVQVAGDWGPGVVMVALGAGMATSVFAAFGLPRVAVIATALSPWLFSGAGAAWGLSQLSRSLALVAVDERGALFSAGLAECLSSRVLGAIGAAGVLAGAALAAVLRVGKDGMRARAGAAVAVVGVGLALISAFDAVARHRTLAAESAADEEVRAALLAASERSQTLGLSLGGAVVLLSLAWGIVLVARHGTGVSRPGLVAAAGIVPLGAIADQVVLAIAQVVQGTAG